MISLDFIICCALFYFWYSRKKGATHQKIVGYTSIFAIFLMSIKISLVVFFIDSDKMTSFIGDEKYTTKDDLILYQQAAGQATLFIPIWFPYFKIKNYINQKTPYFLETSLVKSKHEKLENGSVHDLIDYMNAVARLTENVKEKKFRAPYLKTVLSYLHDDKYQRSLISCDQMSWMFYNLKRIYNVSKKDKVAINISKDEFVKKYSQDIDNKVRDCKRFDSYTSSVLFDNLEKELHKAKLNDICLMNKNNQSCHFLLRRVMSKVREGRNVRYLRDTVSNICKKTDLFDCQSEYIKELIH